MHPLLLHINKQVPLREAEFEEFLRHFKMVEVSKKHPLIQPGQEVKHQYYVQKGCLRTFLIDTDGKEHTIQLAVEDWWVSDYIAYYKESHAILNIECLEDCQLLKISKEELKKLFDQYPQIERYFRKQLENAFVAFQIRILSYLNSSAEEQYNQFINSYPNIEQRVKNYQIASYLGITPESLSRLRKQRANSKG